MNKEIAKVLQDVSNYDLIEELLIRSIEHNDEGETDLDLRILRPGMEKSPKRIVKSWKELFGGYRYDHDQIMQMMTVFKDEYCDEMVMLGDIEFYSTCEHHALPFYGKAYIAYVPKNNQVVGISKLARLLEIYSRRYQIQERICFQVVQSLMEFLSPQGAACVLQARHMCISCRGVNKQSSVMTTAHLEGCFKEDDRCRSEFYSLIGKG